MTRASVWYAKLWRRIERLAAWLLLPLMALQFLSGYAILHWRLFSRILSKPTAFKIHHLIQPVTVAAIAVHGGAAIRRALRRRKLGGLSIDLALVLFGAGLVAFAVYLQLLG